MKYFQKNLDRVYDKFLDRIHFTTKGVVFHCIYSLEQGGLKKHIFKVSPTSIPKFRNNKWRRKIRTLNSLYERTHRGNHN